MNKNRIDMLENELSDFLQKYPHLIPLQFEISKDLAKFDDTEDRLYYMSIRLLDSFQELKEKLQEAHEMFEELK